MNRRFLLFAIPMIAVIAVGGAAWTLMAREHPPGDPEDSEQVAVGSALYGWNCARCHGDDLGGELGLAKKKAGLSDEDVNEVAERLGDIAPAHDKSGSTSRLEDEMLFRIIDEGPKTVLDKPASRMSGYHDRLSEEEIWSIIAFMKSHWQSVADTEY